MDNIFSKGTVTLPVEEYNKLLNEVNKVKNCICIRKGWKDSVDIELDLNALYKLIVEKFNESIYAEQYVLKDADKLYTPNIEVALRAEMSLTEEE